LDHFSAQKYIYLSPALREKERETERETETERERLTLLLLADLLHQGADLNILLPLLTWGGRCAATHYTESTTHVMTKKTQARSARAISLPGEVIAL
jgi:hypothetical protein